MIIFVCEKCCQKIKVPDTAAGKRGKCPKCGHLIIVPQSFSSQQEFEPLRLKRDPEDTPINRPVYITTLQQENRTSFDPTDQIVTERIDSSIT
ncbi:MAG: hypothetical protein WCZ89_01615, partial [Phycisphaerae bacterium]